MFSENVDIKFNFFELFGRLAPPPKKINKKNREELNRTHSAVMEVEGKPEDMCFIWLVGSVWLVGLDFSGAFKRFTYSKNKVCPALKLLQTVTHAASAG